MSNDYGHIQEKNKGGRPPRSRWKLKHLVCDDDASVMEHFKLAAIEAARYLRAVINGDESKPHWARIEAAKFVIDHAIGKASQKVELPTGGANFYFQLILKANKQELPSGTYSGNKQIEGEKPQDIVVEGEVKELTPVRE